MHSPPARPIPRWVQAQILREVRARIDEQVRAYGVDPRTQVLILQVPMADRSVEWRAYGATYPARDAIKAAGFVWDRRGFWISRGEPRWQALAGLDYRTQEARP